MLSVRVLGELALERDGEPADPPAGRPARALLGVLALEHRLHPRSELAARLWPDVLDDSARTSLRGALAALRRGLGPHAERYLVATRTHVGLAADVWTDVGAFQEHVSGGRTQRALDLWRGDLLGGQDDELVLVAREEWRERIAGVLSGLAAHADAAGDAEAAVAYTRQIVALDPLAEAGQRALIRRLAAGGDRGAALAAYARHADRLRTELRIAPSAPTRTLVEEIRAAVPAAATTLEAPSGRGPAPALPGELARSRDRGPLVGRAGALATLEAAWRRTRAGALQVVGVFGEPGIGKTRLVAELCRQAHADGATVLLGRCHEETLLPYEPFVEALRRHAAACPADEWREQAGPGASALARLVPGLPAGEQDSGGRGPGTGSEAERYALIDAVATLLREAARARPAILVLDDLHWADDASLLLLRHVVRVAADVPLLIVGTYRDTEVPGDGALTSALADLQRARVIVSVALGGLEPREVAALIHGRGDALPEAVTSAIAERTEGNPFFVEEIVRHLDDAGLSVVPDSVQGLLQRRLRRLSSAQRRGLGAAAVLGREFDAGTLQRVAGGSEDEVLAAVEAGLEEHVLVDLPDTVGRFAFAHALIHETVYAQLSPARRPGLHERAAQALEAAHAETLDEHAATLAHHFARAGNDVKSLEFQLRAAGVASRLFAPAAAIVHLSAALDTAARLGVSAAGDARVRRALAERGWMRWVTGDDEAGLADYGRALEAARSAGDRPLEAEALDSLAYAEKQFDIARSAAHHEEALVIAEALGDVPLQVRILSRMALTRANNLDLAGAFDTGERARRLAATTGDEHDDAVAIDALKLAALQGGEVDELEALTTQLAAIERRHGGLWYLQWTLLEAAFVPLARARWDVTDARLQEALAVTTRVGDTIGGPMVHDAICWMRRSRGDLAQALEAGRLAVARTDGGASTGWGAWARATLGWALLDLRAADAAVAVLEPGLADAPMLSVRFRVAGHLAWARSLAGDHAGAQEAAAEAERALAPLRVRPGGAFLFGFGATAGLARTHLAAGRVDRAQALVGPVHAAAARAGWHEATALLSLTLGLCRAARGGDDAGARACFGDAISLATAHGLPGVEWEARAALAPLLPDAEAPAMRAASAAVVQRLAAATGDDGLAAGLVRAAQR